MHNNKIFSFSKEIENIDNGIKSGQHIDKFLGKHCPQNTIIQKCLINKRLIA